MPEPVKLLHDCRNDADACYHRTRSSGHRAERGMVGVKSFDHAGDRLAGCCLPSARTIPEMPESYSLAPENPKFNEELREKNVGLGVGGYRAVFTVRGNEVHILTIRRGAQRELGDQELS